jgi:hypothetical protein
MILVEAAIPFAVILCKVKKIFFATILLHHQFILPRNFGGGFMCRELFIYIHDAIIDRKPYFVQKINAASKLGHSSLQKMTVALRMLAYGVTVDLMDEYL